jgi:hypothetical protein
MTLSPEEEAKYWDLDEVPGEGEVEGDDELVVDPSTGVVVSRDEWEAQRRHG